PGKPVLREGEDTYDLAGEEERTVSALGKERAVKVEDLKLGEKARRELIPVLRRRVGMKADVGHELAHEVPDRDRKPTFQKALRAMSGLEGPDRCQGEAIGGKG